MTLVVGIKCPNYGGMETNGGPRIMERVDGSGTLRTGERFGAANMHGGRWKLEGAVNGSIIKQAAIDNGTKKVHKN